MSMQKAFVDYLTEDIQYWNCDEDTRELIAPTDKNTEPFSIYEREDGSIFGVSPKTKEIILAILGEHIDLTNEKESKKKL